MDSFNILFTSAGRRVALLHKFRKALHSLNLRGNLIVADCKNDIATSFVADFHELVPRVEDTHYINCLHNICKKHKIKLVVPLIDPELYKLSIHQPSFAEIGTKILVSSPQTNEICFDKRNTYNFFKSLGIKTPEILTPENIALQQTSIYPLMVKPANGSCSVGVTKVNNSKELFFFQEYVPNAIIQEFVAGQEFTNDVLVDFQGNVKCIVPRQRLETRAGEISKGITVKNKAIIGATKKVVEALPGVTGCVTVQCFLLPNQEIQFIEINPRFGGGIPLSIEAGADFPRWIIEMSLNRPLQIAIDQWQEGVVMLRYDESIFVTKEMI